MAQVFHCLASTHEIESLFPGRGRVKIHEYQAKKILAQYGIPIPRGEVAANPYEAYEIARRLGGTVVLKAQIHAGGRGKGGGVKLAKSPLEAESVARTTL